MSELPETLRREVEDLPRHYQLRHRTVRGRVIFDLQVRGVPVTMSLDPAGYPAEPPDVELAAGWTWEGANGRKIDSLESQVRWNRTLGLAAVLRELKQRFIETPPRHSKLRAGGARMRRSLFEFLFGWVRKLWEWIRRRRLVAAIPGSTEPAARSSEAEALRARYDAILRDHTSRLHRYQGVVDELLEQWRAKSGRLDELRAEIGRLEEREAEALEAARRTVDELQAAGKSTAEIKADPGYRRVQAGYEESTIRLGELRDRVADLETDAERHLAKVRKHEVQLEGLAVELEKLKSEAAEVITDMTLVELEKEILDIRAGLRKSGAAEELESLRHKLRQEQARVRVTREATAIDEGDDDVYLEIAEKVSAARELEATLGLGEPGKAAEKLPE